MTHATLRDMNETFDTPDGQIATLPGATLDADLLPELSRDVTDRSMLVVQYGLAVIAAVAAILLSRAS